MIACKFHKTYPSKHRNFQLDIEATFKVNAINVLFGPSGSGKTSLLRALSGLDKIDKGSIYYNDKVWVNTASKTHIPISNRNIAFVFQDQALFPNMTVLQNLQFAKENTPQNLFKELVDTLELESLLHNKPNQLSGGQKQRVALARAILQEPKLLLLDEPLTALDEKLRSNIQLYLVALQKKLQFTVIMVSHNLQEVLKMAGNICVIENGKVTQQGSPNLLIAENPHNTLQGTVLTIEKDSATLLIAKQQINISKAKIVTTAYKVGDVVEIDLS